jgi:RNA polymerase sigma factor (sigma-70 family)
MSWQAGLGSESWEELFNFLDPNRAAATGPDRNRIAEDKCLEILRKLVFFFAGRRCANAEDLAMETILRVAARCRDVDVSSYGDRVGYFFGVARNVVHEEHRSGLRESKVLESFLREISRTPADPDAWKDAESAQSCLEHCIATLPDAARRLILRYYSNEGTAKVTAHRALADELGKSVNALRIEVHRIRKTLQQCVLYCLQKAAS